MTEFILHTATLFGLGMVTVCGLACWHHLQRIADAVEWAVEAAWRDGLNLAPPGHVGRRRAARRYCVKVRDESR